MIHSTMSSALAESRQGDAKMHCLRSAYSDLCISSIDGGMNYRRLYSMGRDSIPVSGFLVPNITELIAHEICPES